MTERHCPCVANHVPNPKVLHRHHIVPKSWGGTDTTPAHGDALSDLTLDAANLIGLCPTAHENVHRLLNEYVRQGKTPTWDFREHFTYNERLLAGVAWSWWRTNVPEGGRAPYTTPAGVGVREIGT